MDNLDQDHHEKLQALAQVAVDVFNQDGHPYYDQGQKKKYTITLESLTGKDAKFTTVAPFRIYRDLCLLIAQSDYGFDLDTTLAVFKGDKDQSKEGMERARRAIEKGIIHEASLYNKVYRALYDALGNTPLLKKELTETIVDRGINLAKPDFKSRIAPASSRPAMPSSKPSTPDKPSQLTEEALTRHVLNAWNKIQNPKIKVDLSDLKSANKQNAVAIPRNIAMYLSYKLVYGETDTHALTKICASFGGRKEEKVLKALDEVAGMLRVKNTSVAETIRTVAIALQYSAEQTQELLTPPTVRNPPAPPKPPEPKDPAGKQGGKGNDTRDNAGYLVTPTVILDKMAMIWNRGIKGGDHKVGADLKAVLLDVRFRLVQDASRFAMRVLTSTTDKPLTLADIAGHFENCTEEDVLKSVRRVSHRLIENKPMTVKLLTILGNELKCTVAQKRLLLTASQTTAPAPSQPDASEAPQKSIDLKSIKEETARAFNALRNDENFIASLSTHLNRRRHVTVKDIDSGQRARDYVFVRQTAMYSCRQLLPGKAADYPYIGKRFGERDRTTAMHAFEAVAEKIRNKDRSTLGLIAEVGRRLSCSEFGMQILLAGEDIQERKAHEGDWRKLISAKLA